MEPSKTLKLEALNPKLSEWDKKLKNAVMYYQDRIDTVNDNYLVYEGTRDIVNSKGQKSNKSKSSVRKVAFELIESQIDTTIPQPKVTSITGNIDRAQTLEHYLKNELDRLPIEEINDEQGRATPIAGGSFFLVEWDNSIKTRNTVGKLIITNIHPTEVIPQPGVFKLDKMDYWFLRLLQSKREIKERYGIDVSEESNDNPESDETNNEELVTHNYVYYRNSDGDISLFSWVNDKVIQDIDNYFARKIKVCTKCGQAKDDTDTCTKCGNDKFKLETLTMEKLTIPEVQLDPISGEETIEDKEIEIPYYVPKKYPLIVRKNASALDDFLGSSDVEAIKDQQNDLNIYTTKIREKLLKGGSIITIPDDVIFKATDDELKIVKIKNPAQMSMFSAQSLQPSINNDVILLDKTYEIARQTIGITDSFQGRKDSTAISGKAKEFAAAQTAGRLESKRAMKNFAFSQLFDVMFQFILAYADEPRYYNYQDEEGMLQYRMFDKRVFIEKDENGNYYYDDEFIFACDESAVLSTNRRAMWEETRLNYTSGAYGNPQDIGTIVMYWQMMDTLHYPGAKQAFKHANQRLKEQKEQMAQQQQIANKQVEEQNAINAFGKMNNQIKAQQKAQNQVQGGTI